MTIDFEMIDGLVAQLAVARRSCAAGRAIELLEELRAAGVSVEDTPQGIRWRFDQGSTVLPLNPPSSNEAR